jgi:hypothetical protein
MEKQLPIHADVFCSDGLCGHSMQVVIDPVSRVVTHLVVADPGIAWDEHLVSMDQVAEIAPDRIRLTCAAADLKTMRPYLRGEHVPGEIPFMGYDSGEYSLWPMTLAEEPMLAVDHDHTAPGDVALSRGDTVIAADGPVGTLDEFIVDPATDKITHLVLRKGHLWGQKVIAVPVGQIKVIGRESVTLLLTKEQISELPEMPAEGESPPPAAA